MDRPLKIGLFSPYDHAVHGGVRSHISQLASQFREWGHQVRIVAPTSSPQSIDDPDFIPMGRPVPLPSAGSMARVSLSVWLRPQIKDLLTRERFDVLHSHEPLSGYATIGAVGLVDTSSTVNVATFHSYRSRRVWWAIGADKLANPLLRRLHGRIAVSEPAAEFISKHYPGEYEVIPNGITVDDFIPAQPLPELMDGKINLLFLSRLEKRKGLKYLLSAYGKLKWDLARAPAHRGGIGKAGRRLLQDHERAQPSGRGLRGPRLGRDEGAILQVRARLLLSRDRKRELRNSAARSDGRRSARRRHRH